MLLVSWGHPLQHPPGPSPKGGESDPENCLRNSACKPLVPLHAVFPLPLVAGVRFDSGEMCFGFLIIWQNEKQVAAGQQLISDLQPFLKILQWSHALILMKNMIQAWSPGLDQLHRLTETWQHPKLNSSFTLENGWLQEDPFFWDGSIYFQGRTCWINFKGGFTSCL